ncbi:MAG: SbcC/MukB-like Walker B domain-containing protein [Blautia sp.]
MRPILLKMSAFGSYGGEETVDFTKLEQGIFLISGDTGAGKTTIFDGMMYALYDVTSGGKRDGSMMRSQYAQPSAKTYVDFTFSCKGKTYRIYRNPEYERESLRRGKDGQVKLAREKSKTELYLEDGSLYPGMKREVNKKIQQIIGLDGEQFTQVVMIAQGDFLKLLHAKSEERKEIFTQIFHTRIYGRMQDELRRREKEAWQKVKDQERAYELQKASIRWEEEDGDFSVFLERQPEIGQLEEAVADLLAQGRAREKEWEERLSYLRLADDSLKEIKSIEKECQILEKEQLSLENWKQQQSCRFGELEDQARQMEERRQKEGRILTGRRLLLVQAEEKCSALESAQSQYKDCLKRQKGLEAGNRYWKAGLALWEAKSREALFGRLEDRIKALDLAQKEQKRMYQLWQEKDAAYKQKTIGYELANERFYKAQAGILALELEEGCPCPVCGSLHHPQKTALPKETPSQEEVRRLRREQQELEAQREQIQKQLMEANQKTAALATEVTQMGQQVLGADFCCERPWFLQALKRRRELMETLQTLKKQQEAARQEMGKAAARLPEPSSMEEFQNRIEESRNALYKEQETGAALDAQIQMLKKDMDEFVDAGQVRTQMAEVDRMLKKLEEGAALALAKQQAFAKEYHQKSGEAHMLKEKRQKTQAELEQKRTAFEKMRRESQAFSEESLPEELDKAERRHQELYSQNDSNQICLAKLEQIGKQFAAHKKEYEQIHHLSSLAGGSMTGSIKLDFESYVQRQYFSQVIANANRRLQKMTSGEFLLKCRSLGDLKNQGKVGLDLDVYSMVTQKTRDVRTLSGGESFMAALSMALGLADVIQDTAGGISLETMFIDEGFGSLDDHAREQAIRVLSELAGDHRLIGIISHVTELKEQIEQQIVVEKGVHGSRIRQNSEEKF